MCHLLIGCRVLGSIFTFSTSSPSQHILSSDCLFVWLVLFMSAIRLLRIPALQSFVRLHCAGLVNTRGIVLQYNSRLTELQGIDKNISSREFYWRELIKSTRGRETNNSNKVAILVKKNLKQSSANFKLV